MDTDSIKKETEDPALGTVDSTSKSSNRKKVGVAPVGVQDYAEKFDIASPRGTDSRKSSRSSRSSLEGGTERERERSPRLISHRGPGALCASPLDDDSKRDPSPPTSPRAIAPHDSGSSHSSGLASAQPAPNTIQIIHTKVWQGPLPERFYSHEDVMYWEQQVQSRVQVLLEEKQEQTKTEANSLWNNFEQRAELYKSEARQLVIQSEQMTKQECHREFSHHMADMSSELHQSQQETARLRGLAQSRADAGHRLANQAEAASVEAASVKSNLEMAVSLNHEQAQRTASMEHSAEQYVQDLRVRYKNEKDEYDQIIAVQVQEMSETHQENRMLKQELAARTSELAAGSPNDVVCTGDAKTQVDSIRLELQESLMQQQEMKIKMAEERWEAINHAANMEMSEARTRTEYNAMLEKERSMTAKYKEKQEKDRQKFQRDLEHVLDSKEKQLGIPSSSRSHPAALQATGTDSTPGSTFVPRTLFPPGAEISPDAPPTSFPNTSTLWFSEGKQRGQSDKSGASKDESSTGKKSVSWKQSSSDKIIYYFTRELSGNRTAFRVPLSKEWCPDRQINEIMVWELYQAIIVNLSITI